MKAIIFSLMISISSLLSFTTASCQTYTTESKNCGACGKEVSIYSTVGMTCPHCGVRWGYENTSKTTTTATSATSYSNNEYESMNYNPTKTTGINYFQANLRELPTTRSKIKSVIPKYTTMNIVASSNSWYYVRYSYFNGYTRENMYGYVSKSIVN